MTLEVEAGHLLPGAGSSGAYRHVKEDRICAVGSGTEIRRSAAPHRLRTRAPRPPNVSAREFAVRIAKGVDRQNRQNMPIEGRGHLANPR